MREGPSSSPSFNNLLGDKLHYGFFMCAILGGMCFYI